MQVIKLNLAEQNSLFRNRKIIIGKTIWIDGFHYKKQIK